MRRNKSCKTKVREEGAAPRAQGHGLVEGRARRQSRGRPSAVARPAARGHSARHEPQGSGARAVQPSRQRAARQSPLWGAAWHLEVGSGSNTTAAKAPHLDRLVRPPRRTPGPALHACCSGPRGPPPRSAQPSPPPPGSQGVQPAWSPWPRWWRTCSSRWLIWPLTPVLDLDCSSSLLALDVGSPLCFRDPSCRQAGSLPPRPTPTHRGTERDPELLPVPAGTTGEQPRPAEQLARRT